MNTNVAHATDIPAAWHKAVRTDADLLELLALREIEVSGSLTGLDAINRVASTAGLLGIKSPGYTLLHDLIEKGFLQSDEGRPPLYLITEAGVREAERLAEEFWPRLHGEVASLSRRLATASPRGTQIPASGDWVGAPKLRTPNGRS